MKRLFGLALSAALFATPGYAQPHGNYSNHGEVIGNPCPFSCQTQGIPKNLCRDWRDPSTNTCYIEDLRNPRGWRGSYPPLGVSGGSYRQPQAPAYNPPPNYPPPYNQGTGDCQNVDRRDISGPHVSIGRVTPSGGLFSDKAKVQGSVEGVCLVEAGLFEDGRNVQSIPINTVRSFQRFEFEVKARSDRNPEIRVYNSAGDRDIYAIRGDNSGNDRGGHDYDR